MRDRLDGFAIGKAHHLNRQLLYERREAHLNRGGVSKFQLRLRTASVSTTAFIPNAASLSTNCQCSLRCTGPVTRSVPPFSTYFMRAVQASSLSACGAGRMASFGDPRSARRFSVTKRKGV